MTNNRLVYKDYTTLMPLDTSHGIGQKKVLLANEETTSDVTQIAITKLFAGDVVLEHVHYTMDEHYITTSGIATIIVDGEEYNLKTGKFILVPAGCYHSLSIITDIELIIISVAI